MLFRSDFVARFYDVWSAEIRPELQRFGIKLCEAAELKIGISAVRIAGGERGRTKRIEVRGVERGRILDLLTKDV